MALCCFVVHAFTSGMQLSFAALAPGLADHCLAQQQPMPPTRAGTGVAVQEVRTREELQADAGTASIVVLGGWRILPPSIMREEAGGGGKWQLRWR